MATETTTAEQLDTPSQVRQAVKAFLDENWNPETSLKDWLGLLADSGWAVPQWPVQWFGKGLTNELTAAAFDEFKTVMAPGPPGGLSRMLAAPTIISHGSDEQRQAYVRRILVGEDAWCQLFSEPGAGSDLASLQTRAELDGDEYVVNGQKVWTSGAMGSDVGMLIARTDPDAVKHAGITYFAIEMDQPGIEVRPLRQITGEAHFAEVFLTDARVSADNIIGGLNNGWNVARTTLANERVGLGGGGSLGFPLSAPGGRRSAQLLEQSVGEFIESQRRQATGGRVPAMMMVRNGEALAKMAKSMGRDKDPAVRLGIARVHALTSLNRWNTLRARAAVEAGGRPGPEASLGKLMVSRITRMSRDVGMEIAGPQGMLAGEDGPLHGALALQFLGAPAPSIYGGSDEVQHNIIGERVLGLPREPDASKDVPFRSLRTGTQAQ
jgi:alkylation response protein AidB-like acyl-CoA dehydrogenase